MAGEARNYRASYSGTARRVNSERSATGAYQRRRSVSAPSDIGVRYRWNTYEDGSAVRELWEEEEEPGRRPAEPEVSERTKQNRARARSIGIGYVAFLTAVCLVSLFLCIHYLQLRSQLINQTETIAAMESKLSRLRADNDAYYKQAQASLDLEAIRETALNDLDMHYAGESQIRYYSVDGESYVRQYKEVPSR